MRKRDAYCRYCGKYVAESREGLHKHHKKYHKKEIARKEKSYRQIGLGLLRGM
jgi:hypothetical protein